jgi:hypothetical protein
MGMAVQDQFGTAFGDHFAECGAVEQGLAPAHRVRRRRMMQQHDTEQARTGSLFQHAIESSKLALAQPPRGQERRRWLRGRQADQGDDAVCAS